MPTVAELVGRTLTDLGVRQAFGLIGSGNFDLSNALTAGGARFVTARHETNAVMMADAYSRVTGEVGVVTLHPGCGLTNAITGVTEAAKSRTSLLVLAGDTAAAAVRSNFRIDQDSLAISVGALADRVFGPASVVQDICRAHRRASEDRRTVVASLPMDVQAAPVPGEYRVPARSPIPRPHPDPATVERVADVLCSGRRPLLIGGRGARGQRSALELLAERTGALLATTAVARGLFAGNPWSLDVSGGFSSPGAAELISAADVVVAFGAALNMWSTRHGRLLGDSATVVQVDLDVDAIGSHQPAHIGVIGDAAATATALCAALDRRSAEPSRQRTPELAERIRAARWAEVPYDDVSTVEAIDPRTLTVRLDEILPPERSLAVDSGHFMGWPSRYLSVPDEQGFIFSQAFQCVGLGLGTAIGLAVARPDRLTIAALGDGGALMALADLETVARLGLRMVVLIYNDQAYGAEVHHFGPDGKPLELVQFPDTDFAALGRAVGLAGVTVRAPADLEQVEDWLRRGTQGGLVIDAKVVPTLVADWLEEAFRGH
ncbi:MAG: thiamine pyrophosphate-binding protein [Candidatus Dormibacteraeota bacterium]|uniref:Thiamine pyrophosphate-binding protein n=1 Tax=Candidatus Dormiibacter inghamiae TaxID=3127013 RepID=A0A934ND43_9BACT|nr:thiamine pyrophosphate-binding protein [Candidatus Dormibacteraeota bacterium]MBJ7606101.1 thiamine pyrophosphate-binding protein [Candidatus Dormibacteraeota bacterium]